MTKFITVAMLSVAPFVVPLVAPLVAQAADNWTGPYVGAQAGAQFGNISGPFEYADKTGPSPYKNNPYGAIVGVRAGYNQQINHLVLGVEADANLSGNVKQTKVNPDGYTVAASNAYTANVRVRLGYDLGYTDASELVYVAGGVAFGDVKTGYSGLDQTPFTNTAEHTGYTLGVGFEHRFTNLISGTAEYRYTDFGSKSFTNVPNNTYDKVKYTTSGLLFGVNYKF